MSEQKQHYHLVYGELVYAKAETPDELGASNLNCVLTTADGRITTKALGIAQQSLQQALHQRVQEGEVIVRDVLLVNIVHLGEMTATEFFGQDPLASAPKAATAQAQAQ
jgi:hypothetical protein